MANLNFVDLVIIAIFFFTIVAGFARGLVSQVISLATWVVAVIVASMFANPLAQTFTKNDAVQGAVSQASSAIGVNAAQPISYATIGICFFIIFVGVLVLGSLISSIFNLAFQSGILGIGNRLLGALFGFCRGFIINLVLIFLVQLTPFATSAWWTGSVMVQQFQPAVQWLDGVVSPSLAGIKAKVSQEIQDVGSSLENVTKSAVSGFTQ